MLFDTHAHYDDESFDADRDAVLTALPEQGVGLILNPGCDVESSRKAVRYAAAYPHVYAAVGIHPENCGGCTAGDLDAIRALAQQPKTVAIGEIGLDYYWRRTRPGTSSSRCSGSSWRWRGSWRCPSSSTTGRPTPTRWPSSGSSAASPACSTASPAARRWRGSC